MKFTSAILVLLGVVNVDAIRMNIKGDDNVVKVPEQIVLDAASKGIKNMTSGTVADVAADVGRIQRTLEEQSEARRLEHQADQRERRGEETWAKAEAERERQLAARNNNQKIQSRLEGVDVMGHNNRRVEEIAAEAQEADRLEAIQAKKGREEAADRAQRKEDALRIKEYRSDHL